MCVNDTTDLADTDDQGTQHKPGAAAVTHVWRAGPHLNNEVMCSNNTTSGIMTTHHPGHHAATHVMHHLLPAELNCRLRMQTQTPYDAIRMQRRPQKLGYMQRKPSYPHMQLCHTTHPTLGPQLHPKNRAGKLSSTPHMEQSRCLGAPKHLPSGNNGRTIMHA